MQRKLWKKKFINVSDNNFSYYNSVVAILMVIRKFISCTPTVRTSQCDIFNATYLSKTFVLGSVTSPLNYILCLLMLPNKLKLKHDRK